MTTPSEITATEKLLELIRASSLTESKDTIAASGTSDSIIERDTQAIDPLPPITRVLTAEEKTLPPLTLETPDTDDNITVPSPSPIDQTEPSPPPAAQDIEKLLDLIRTTSSDDNSIDDQEIKTTDFVLELDSLPQLPKNNQELGDSLESTKTKQDNKEHTNFTLTLEDIDHEDNSNSPPEAPLPQAELGKSPSSARTENVSLIDELTKSSPPLNTAKPSDTSTLPQDDDDDVFPLPSRDHSPTPGPEIESDKTSLIPASASSFTLRSFLNFKRLKPVSKTTIGIDIRPGVIHIVKSKKNKTGADLLAYESVPYDFDPVAEPKNLFEDQEFMGVLFRTLANFHTSQEHHEIWCSYPFLTPIELHNISIPKVADKDLATAVFWSAKRDVEFDEAACIFDFFPLQEINEANQAKTQALVTLAPASEVEGVKAMFKNAGFPLTGISFPAAAIQNFLIHDPAIPTDQPVVYFTIRKSYSFIDLFYKGKMFFSREIKTGVDSFVESLLDQAQSQRIVIDEENATEYLFRSGNGRATPHIENDSLYALFDWEKLSVVGRLARQLVRTFEYCSTTFKIPPVGAIVTSGEFSINDPILKSLENRVGIKCAVIEPFPSTIFHLDSVLTPPSNSNMLAASGLSLSDKQTTANFLFTYADRAKEASSKKVNSIIAIVSICLALGMGATFAWQYNKVFDKKKNVAHLQQQLAEKFQLDPRSQNNDYLTQTVQKIRQFNVDNKEKTKRFKSVAIIGELTRALYSEITLTNLVLDLNPGSGEAQTKHGSSAEEGTMVINGYISAPSSNSEFILMNFLKDLGQLNILGNPSLVSKSNDSLNKKDVLRFEVKLKTTLNFLDPPST